LTEVPTPEQDARTLSRDRYSQFAEHYVESVAHSQGTDLEQLVAIAAPQPTWTVLDVATGGGHTALALAPWVARVVATDLVPDMLGAARRFLRAQTTAHISFAVADAEDLPFADETFDLVTCRIAPHHFRDAARFVREGARVLQPARPGENGARGTLLIQDHVLPDELTAARYVDAWERLRDPSHHRAFSEAEWKAILHDAGLQVCHIEQATKQHAFLDWTQRQGCAPAVVDQLIEQMDAAPEAVVAWMQPRCLGTPEASFVNRHILIAGRKR
jgi:ubiquinone/menaquinone biosynthesis C-methylase UbiE